MNRTRGPCPQNCPERSPTCHATCRTYLEHHEARKEIDAAREREMQILAFQTDARQRVRKKKDGRKKSR